MKKLLLTFSILFVSTFISIKTANAQCWDKFYHLDNPMSISSNVIKNCSDGGYIAAGSNYVLKVDKKGAQEWQQYIYGNFYSVYESSDGSILVSGISDDLLPKTIKLSSSGTILWTQKLTNYSYGTYYTAIETDDGSYLIAGNVYDSIAKDHTVLTKVTNSGTILWTREYLYSFYPNYIKKVNSTNYTLYSTSKAPYYLSNRGLKMIVSEVNGDTLSTHPSEAYYISGQETKDGGYISACSNFRLGNAATTKMNAAGQIEFSQSLSTERNEQICTYDIKELTDGNFVFAGYLWIGPSSIPVIGKINSLGELLWYSEIQSYNSNQEQAQSIDISQDGGYVTTINGFPSPNYARIVKTDSQGSIYSSFIKGSVYLDLNNNCKRDNGETSLPKMKIQVDELGTDVSIDSNGNYNIAFSDTGTFTLRPTLYGNFWKVECPISQSQIVHLTKFDTIASNIDFGLIPDQPGPLLFVDVVSALGFLRPCFHNTHHVTYANLGNEDVNNVLIELQLDPKIIPLSASLPYSTNGNILTFTLGTLSPGETGRILLRDSVSCESLLHSTACIEAKIVPDIMIDTSGGKWDRSSIVVTGACNGSTIDFTITNDGSSMAGPTQYRLYADDEFISSDYIQLAAGEIKTITIPADGKTYRLEADQRPYHPGKSFPRQTIEGCGTNAMGTSSLGFVNTVIQDDAASNVEFLCEAIRQPFDPNEKLVYPEGVGPGNYISKNDELEYFITFQNTGSDTAFTVVLKDTLSQALDILTLEPGLSSSPYTYKVDLMSRVVDFTFSNIRLPDSTTNEPKSHGFIKYKIQQKADNALGTSIENRAAIIFDFNAPIITNTATVEVNEINNKTTGITSSTDQQNEAVLVYPNPIVDRATIKVDQLNSGFSFQLFDLTGNEVYKNQVSGNVLNFEKGNLMEGFYSYKITNDKGLEAHGKIIVQ